MPSSLSSPPSTLPPPHSTLLNTLAHAGCSVDATYGTLVMPPYFNSTFERGVDGEYAHGNVYGRGSNPTRQLFEQTMAKLEEADEADAFSSGSAGFYAIFSALKQGDHVLLPDDVYHGTRVLLTDVMDGMGIVFSTCDMSDAAVVENSIQANTKLIVLETPSNPLLKITPLEKIIQIAKQAKLVTVVDNTWSTPLITQPMRFGADLVLHSATKYIGGHSDLLGGVVCGKKGDEIWEKVKAIQGIGGAIMDPMTAWLCMRGLRSMAVRLQRQCENAMAIAGFLSTRKEVEAVYYPTKNEKDASVIQQQMYWPGAMLSFTLKDAGQKECLDAVGKCKLFTRATSLGGTESLIEHRASVEAQPTRTPDNLIRMSVGLEASESLIEDLERMFK